MISRAIMAIASAPVMAASSMRRGSVAFLARYSEIDESKSDEVDEVCDGVERGDSWPVTCADHDIDEMQNGDDGPADGHDESDPEVADLHRARRLAQHLGHSAEIHLAQDVEPEGDRQQHTERGIEDVRVAQIPAEHHEKCSDRRTPEHPGRHRTRNVGE